MFQRINNVGSIQDDSHVPIAKNTSQALVGGDVLAWDRSENYVQRATSDTDNHGSDCYAGVVVGDKAATDTEVDVLFFQHNQVFEVDCNSDTATSQIGHRYHLTDHDTLDNDGTDGTSAKDIFEVIKIIGAASDKKVHVRVINPAGQATA